MNRLHITLCLLVSLVCTSCKPEASLPKDARTAAAEKVVREKWGKGINDLPRVKLVLITANNENITNEYGWAFALQYAQDYGQLVEFVWRDVGGGASAIEKHVISLYSKPDPKTGRFEDASSGIDIVWGGGEDMFMRLAKPTANHPHGLLEKLDLPQGVLDQIASPGAEQPNVLGGLPFYDRDLRWVGSAVSSFGFLYNSGMVRKCGLVPPAVWQDVGDDRYTDLVTLADPSQSGSVAKSYHLIVQSAATWADGWARLLRVLSNSKRFSDSAGAAANSPVLGEGLVASCIDFYGLMRVAEAPDQLAYVNPPGQTTFGADPIAILKNPPSPELAQRFVQFVMSPRGQALWALPVGAVDGPVRTALGRLPIRRDVYRIYKDGIAAPMDFYDSPAIMQVSPEAGRVNFSVLRQLVASGIVENVDSMRRARRRLNELARDGSRRELYAAMLAEFNRLPENVATVDAMKAIGPRLGDAVEFYNITKGWRDFFHDKFERIAQER